jgi:hypothetical protein
MDFNKCAEIMLTIARKNKTGTSRHRFLKNSPPGILNWLKQIENQYLLTYAIRYAKSKMPDKDFKFVVKENLPPNCPGLTDGKLRRWLRSI